MDSIVFFYQHKAVNFVYKCRKGTVAILSDIKVIIFFLYTGNVDGFCIVSSDGDFTRLAIRLKESGMDVIGMGESKTPRSFRAACTVFTDLEILYEAESEDDEISTKGKKPAVKHNVVKVSEIENELLR